MSIIFDKVIDNNLTIDRLFIYKKMNKEVLDVIFKSN